MAKADSNKFHFTDRALDARIKAVGGDCQLRDATTSGLYLKVKGDRRDWYLIKRIAGKLYYRSLGPRALMPLPVARAAAQQLYLQLRGGADPLEQQREAAVEAQAAQVEEVRAATTLAQALEQMLDGAQLSENTIRTYRRCVGKAGAFYKHRNTPLTEITEEIVLDCHKRKSRISETQANKDCRTVRAVWNWAQKPLNLAGSNPVAVLNRGRKVAGQRGWNRNPRRKTAVLRHQLPAWFEVIRGLQRSADTTTARQATAMEFMLLTGLRRQEVLGMQWSWISWTDLTMTIPAGNSKNRQPLTRPLTQRGQQLLKSMEGLSRQWVFPSTTPGRPLHNTIKVQQQLQGRAGLWTPPNDLRRTFASAAPAAGLAQHTIKALMNHLTDSDVTQGYQVVDLDTLLEASQQVEDFILTEAGVLDRSLDTTLMGIIATMTDGQKRRLIFELSAQQAERGRSHG